MECPYQRGRRRITTWNPCVAETKSPTFYPPLGTLQILTQTQLKTKSSAELRERKESDFNFNGHKHATGSPFFWTGHLHIKMDIIIWCEYSAADLLLYQGTCKKSPFVIVQMRILTRSCFLHNRIYLVLVSELQFHPRRPPQLQFPI